jgi:ABC-type phosphate transport system permease subunit
MMEEATTSPLAYGWGTWYTKQATNRFLLSLPSSVTPALFGIFHCLNNPTCLAGDLAGISGAIGLGAGVFLSSYKWVGSPNKPFISLDLVSISLKLFFLTFIFVSAFFLTKSSFLVFGSAILYGFTIWFIFGAFTFWALNKLIFRNKKSEV